MPRRLEIKAFENVEHLDHRHPAGARWGHGDDFISAVGSANRWTLLRFIGGEVGLRDQASARTHVIRECRSSLSFIETVAPLVANTRQRLCEIGKLDALTSAIRNTVLGICGNACGVRREVPLDGA